MVSCPSVNNRVLFFLARVCSSVVLEVMLMTKQTPYEEKQKYYLLVKCSQINLYFIIFRMPVCSDLTRKGASLCFMSVTDLRKLLWYPIRAELTFAVFDKIDPINKHHQWFLHLNVTQHRAEF